MLRNVLSRVILPALSLASILVLSAATQPAAAQQGEQPTKGQIEAFQNAKLSIGGAIAAAGKQSGGKVIEATFATRQGKPIYKVRTYQNNSIWEGAIDAESGQALGAGKTTQEGQLDKEDKAELAGLPKFTISLNDATAAAEKESGGKAIGAGVEEVKGQIVVEVFTVKQGAVRKITVDPRTGKVMK